MGNRIQRVREERELEAALLQSRGSSPLPAGVQQHGELFVDHVAKSCSFLDPRLPAAAQPLAARLRRPPPYDARFDGPRAAQTRLRHRWIQRAQLEEATVTLARAHLMEEARHLLEDTQSTLLTCANLRIQFAGEVKQRSKDVCLCVLLND